MEIMATITAAIAARGVFSNQIKNSETAFSPVVRSITVAARKRLKEGRSGRRWLEAAWKTLCFADRSPVGHRSHN
jgi:hypothetical protein